MVEKSPETDIRDEAGEFFIKSIDSEEFKFIHIASHGFINSQKPEFSGILFANDNIDDNDGILLMNEIFDIKLNSDLIVLSAFETGIKEFRRGEGVLGLTRALLYTGTKNIVISLWQVSDESTVNLMLNFYEDILNKYENPYGFNHSLRTAKLKLIKEGKYAHIRLPSSEVRLVNIECMATIGQVGNVIHGNLSHGKAGKNRWLGIRPTVRGVAMNPVDHPMGGGEGKSSGGRHPVSPTGVPAKGYRTRKKNKQSDKYIVKRRTIKK